MKLRIILPAALALSVLFPASLALAMHTAPANASHNWAGYVAESGTYSAVNGSWVVPAPSPGATTASDAEWIGIGGMHGADLIQAGTRARITTDGTATYEAWYELFPAPAVPVSMTVEPGDTMSASLKEVAANQWQITLTDLTTGARFETTQNYRSSESSAEWILEAPGTPAGALLPLDTFGSVAFSNASATLGGVAESPAALHATKLSLVNASSTLLASASALANSGSAFSVVRD
jgi:hypothetical protein